MARQGLFGGFHFDEEVFTDMMQEADYWSNPIMASGIVLNDESIMDLIGAKGNVATIPLYKPLNINDENMAPLNNDGETDNVPVEISGSKQTCMLIQRMKSFKAKDFTKELTGADPLNNVKNKIQNYYTQVWESELMNIAQGILGVADMSDHVTDLSVTTGTISDVNKVGATTLIEAEQTALGDMAGGMGLLVMHSAIFAEYQKLSLVDYDKYTVGNVITKDVKLPTIGGKHVLVTDYYTVDTSVKGFPVYSTYLFGEGAFLTAEKKNYENQYTTKYDPQTAAGTDMFFSKQGKVLHPNGLSLKVDNVAKESPTKAELATVANWELKFNHKNVKMGVIKSNG
ncbi:major capsid protein [Ihubacter sp. rT4E-8]|uniref:major capsid protein n=1 Tax=Ihubacter sp. rT4E-8 TaxID=3242369 RepID=UPI003CEF847A